MAGILDGVTTGAVVAEALVVVVHFAFLAVLVVGGLVARRHRWVLPVHLGMVAWAVLSVAFTWDCPLTDLQQVLRAAAGRPPLTAGFIDTYVSGVLVPDADGPVQVAVLAVVLTSWALLVRDVRRRRANPVTAGPPTRG